MKLTRAKHFAIGAAALLISLVFGFSFAFAADTPTKITVTYCVECVPFEFTNADGKADGQIIDYWKLWSKKTGISVRFVPAPWNQTLSNVADGKVDAHAGLFFSNERNTYLDYGSALTDTDTHVFFHEDVAFPETLAELKSYRIAVLSGDLVEGWLKSRLGEASVVGYKDYQSIVAALNSGEIKVFAADTQTALYHLGRADLLTRFRHQKLKPLYTSKWFVAAQKGNQPLLDIINEGMGRINAEERLRISRSWASGTRSEDPDSVIVAIDSYYPPLSSIGIDGEPQGLMVDIWREWGRVVNRKIRFKASNWNQTLDDIRAGEADIHMGLFKSEDREKWLAFSQPIQVIKTGLFSKTGSNEGHSMAALKGKRVGAVAGSYQARYIEDNHPEVSLHKFADRTEYLMALMRGEIVAIVEEIPTVDAALAKFGLTGSVSRRAELFENQVFAGVRKDNTALLELVNTGLDFIPRERLAKIEARWIVNPEDRFFSETKGVAHLTNAQKKWVAAHRTISIAATPDWPPFEWKDESTGEHRGISADFMRLAAEKVGLKLAPEFAPWTPLVEKLKNKEIDVAPGLNRTPDREKFLLFTESFVDYFSVIFTSEGRDDISSMADLDGKTVAVEKGYFLSEVLARDYPKIDLKLVDTTVQALQAVSAKNVDAFVGNQLVGTHLIKKYLIANVKTTGFYNKIPGHLRFGVRKDWPILRLLLDKGLAAITEVERNRIIKTHTGMQLDMGKRVRLTDKERDWLNQHRTVRLGVDSNLPPFEFLDDDGKYSGISADYIEVLSKQLDIAMIPQLEYSWSEAIKAIEEGGNIDILPGVVNTPDRQEYMNFTKSYISFPVVIAMQNDAPYIGGLSDMSGKKVGVIRGYFSHKMLEANHPEIIPVFVETVADGLIAVDKGETDAFFEDMAVITYEKNRLGLDNIKIAAPSKFKTDLSIGVRKDWPELIPILNKALDTIDKKERAAIQNTWMSFRVSFGWDIKTILLWALPIGGGAALIIFIIVLWNRRLGTEIIERKRAEEDLAVRTNLLQTVLSSMTQGIVAFDKDLELISWNNRFKEIRDYPSEFFEEGRNFREFMQYDIDRDEFIYEDPGIGLEQQVERAKQFEPHAFERQRPDGSFIEVRGGPIPGGGFVSTYADVTVRKRAELELKIAKEKADTATQVAEEATKAKATFLATMSHEIRTPMGGVIGMVDLLRQSKMTDDQRQMIDTVGDSAHSLLTIINDILDFSKIEAGKLDLEEIPISIRDVVEGAGEALAVNARNKDIGLSVYVDPDIPDALVGDQVRVRQILFNFGTNAIKFTEKGKVLLRADKVPSQDKGKATVRFQVIDEGIGIPEEAQAKLFQAFSQVDASTTRRFGGTGLGLTICQRLTEIMNGEIGVESVPGEGSTFSVTIAFPVAEEHTFKSDGHDLDGLNVLLAYKDDVMRVLVPRYLEHWKATVTATAEFDKAKSMALDAARDGTPFDVICLGSGWPFDEQVDAARSLQAEKKLSSTGYVVACRGRVKVDRPEIDNTVYVDAGPLRRAAFIKSVAVAAGRASPEVEYDDSEITLDAGKAPTVAEAEAMGQLILVAEDNVTNQDVIRRQLTMLGYALEIANDGKEALELLQSKSFAILLTDCHMPNMDGFELTETIRKSEKDNDVRFPIVAITASVMKEEVDNCFAAGMDDYLAKPLEMKKLKEMLQNWMPASDGVAEAAEEPDAEDTTDKPEAEDDGGDGPIDPSALKSVFGDDDDTFKEILKDFVTPATNNIADIESAFADRSADDVAKAAHKLKSSARAVGANELADLCLTLETAGKAEDWDEIDKSAPRITEVMKEVADYIARM